MADNFIKDNDGNFMKDSNGIYLKSRPFNQQVIQDGLTFWGSSDPAYLTLINGKVSEAYDIRGTGAKMVQGTVTNRPDYQLGRIGCSVAKWLEISNSTISSGFIIARFIFCVNGGRMNGLAFPGASLNNYLGFGLNGAVYTLNIGNTSGVHYLNNVKYSAQTPTLSYGYKIMHSLSSIAVGTTPVFIGSKDLQVSKNMEIMEWGWYNRVLSEQEVIYNINALNTKHLVF